MNQEQLNKYELGHVAKVLLELHLEQPDKFSDTFVIDSLLNKYNQLFVEGVISSDEKTTLC